MGEIVNQRQYNLSVLLKALSPIVRPVMLKYFAPDCCVATCKMLKEIFTDYGYKASAVPVTVQVLNKPMQVLWDTVPLPEDRDERMALFNQHGAWGVGIGPVPGETTVPIPGKFNGHLVLNVEGLLVDASLQQAQREEKGILIPPMIYFPAPSGFFAKPKGQQVRGLVGETLVVYRRLRDDYYTTGRNWRERHAGSYEAYLKIMRKLRETN